MTAALRRFTGLEPAIFVALAARIWQSLAGLMTLYFVVRYLSPTIQGYYQTFLSLIALQSFLELGILVAIVSVVSHEWAGLSLEKQSLVGDEMRRARLASVTRFVGLWFGGASALFLIVGGLAGYLVMARHGEMELWLAPWVATILLAACYFGLQGFIALLEGCNQILPVALYRLVQSVVAALFLWLAISSGAGLWSLAIQLGGSVLVAATFLIWRFGPFLSALIRSRAPSSFNWRIDVWPMQWPLAIQGLVAYFNFALFTPVIFTYHGAIEAGRIGLSVQVVTALTAIGAAFLAVRAPRMGTAYAMGDLERYRGIWRGAAALSLATVAGGSVVIALAISLGVQNGFAAASRFLDPIAFGALLLWGLILNVNQCLASYWRAQRIEPVGFLGAIPGLLAGLAIWVLGSRYGSLGATSGALAAIAVSGLPLCIYFYARARRVHVIVSAQQT